MRASFVWSIVALNAAVFVLWLALGETPFMLDNFLVSWRALQEGRYWTLLTAAFSHIQVWHLVFNMLVLTSFGPPVEKTIGSRRFLSFYLVAAVVSSLSHGAVSAFILHQPDLPALGASGAISGVVVVFALLYPRAKIALLGIIPLPALLGAALFVGIDIVGVVAQSEGGGLPIGHGAHLGGALTGALYYFLAIRPQRTRAGGRSGDI